MKLKDIYAVKELLGHKDISMTKRYAHLTEDYLRQVVNEMGINAANITESEEHGTLKPLSEADNNGHNNWLREPEVAGSSPVAPSF